jgi:UDP-N-acetylglucosamine 2-epimerase (non-hydrolysing)
LKDRPEHFGHSQPLFIEIETPKKEVVLSKPIMCIVGTRPNYMKMAPILAAFASHNPPIPFYLVHTGQHYDAAMEKVFFEALNMPEPSVNLAVGAGSHAIQTAEIMKRLDPVMDTVNPGAMLVVGDVNSTLAAALVASKRGVPVIHVEAGLRSGDRAMPEETNRLIVDRISDILYTTDKTAAETLTKEGLLSEQIEFVGNVMIDTLITFKEKCIPGFQTISANGGEAKLKASKHGYALATLHRPSNVDDPVVFASLIKTLNEISEQMPVVFPIHPRTRGNLSKFGLESKLSSNWLLIPPQGYLEMLGLMRDAKIVLTDSGGVQEETTVLGVSCLTLRKNTERPVTVTDGTNHLVGIEHADIIQAFTAVMADQSTTKRSPPLWDGQAAKRIAASMWARGSQLGIR